jgi:hypothetical protein
VSDSWKPSRAGIGLQKAHQIHLYHGIGAFSQKTFHVGKKETQKCAQWKKPEMVL